MFRLTTTQSHEPMGDWWLKAMDQVIASVPMGRRERCVSGQDDLQRPTRSPNALQRPRQATPGAAPPSKP